MAIEKIKILGAVLSYQLNSTVNLALLPQIGPNWPNQQCCLASRSKTAPKILIFSIAMDAKNSFYVKFIATYAPTFFGFIISVLAMVKQQRFFTFESLRQKLKQRKLVFSYWLMQ